MTISASPHNPSPQPPPALVLAFSVTGLATVRGLARGGMPVHAAIFRNKPTARAVRYSRHCKTHELPFEPEDEAALCEWLRSFAQSFDIRPVVIPTSDQTALFLSRHRDMLDRLFQFWNTDHEMLEDIISKERLYRIAHQAGIPVLPMISEPEPGELHAWCREHAPPYLIKPFYGAAPQCLLRTKNRVFTKASRLLDYANGMGMRKIIVQRFISGGDGHIIDCYGLCNRNGQPLTLATHRRLRQHMPDTGVTTYGEIPALGVDEDRVFDLTRKLLAQFRFHGIFGIEWLRDRNSGELYLIDFNARPFSSIGHLTDCGLNLPLLAYQELVSQTDPQVPVRPALAHKCWIDFNKDLRNLRHRFRAGELHWPTYLKSLTQVRSCAYLSLTDPGPGLYRAWDLSISLLKFFRRQLRRKAG